MRRYEKYKDSGVEWIGEIPEHWEVKKIKYVASFNDEVLTEKTNSAYEIEYIDISSIESNVGIIKTETYTFENAPSRARRIVRDGDIIVSTVRTYLKSIAKISNPPSNLIVSTGFAVIRSIHLISDYTGYLFYCENLLGEIISRSVGVSYPAINASEIASIPISLPTPEEQTAIATYLDHKTAEIDALITDKKRLLELYEEEKSAIINEAVTKGLASTRLASTSSAALGGVGSKKKKVLEESAAGGGVRMKDSGIEWMGDIPAHWEVKRLKYVATLKSGEGIISEQITERGEYPVYGGNGMRGYFSDFTHDGNFILIGRQGAYCGNIKYGQGKFWASEHAVVVKPIIEYELYYLGELLRAMNLNQFSVSAAQPGLAVDNIKNLNIPFPPIEEQKEIVQYIEAETQRIDTKKVRTQKLIDLLTEYRTALISEVVTGKVKVV